MKINNKLTRKAILYAFISAVVIILGFFLTKIVAGIALDNQVTVYRGSIDPDIVIYNGEAGQAFIQNSYAEDKLGLKYALYGGAFVVTHEDNTNRVVHFLFQNVESGKIYQVSTDVYSRPDVYAKMREEYYLNPNYNYGMYSSFSPACIYENGVYLTYISVEENEKDKGIFNTGRYYCKEGSTFEEWEYKFFPESMISIDGKELPTNSLKAYASGISVNNNKGYVWSLGEKSDILLSIEGQEDYSCTVNVISTITDSQRLVISSNNQVLFEDTLTGAGEILFSIPKECISEGIIELKFEYPDSLVPKDAGINEDTRRIAIAFNKIILE